MPYPQNFWGKFLIKCIYMALDPEKELYILAIYDDFSKYSAPKGFFLNQWSRPIFLFFSFMTSNISKIFFGVKCLFQLIFNLYFMYWIWVRTYFPKTWQLLHNFLFYFLGKLFIFLDESWDRTLLEIWSHL